MTVAPYRYLIAASASLLLLSACSSQEPSSTTAADPTNTTAIPEQANGSLPETSSSTSPSTRPSPSPTPSKQPGKILYLTFDDGPAVPYTDQLLKILKRHDAKATFFVNGNMAKANPTQVQNIIDAGQAFGNHTWDHPHLPTLSDQGILEQLNSTKKVIGSQMGACMRPPYLDTNDRVRGVSKQAGYSTIMGDLGAQDWTTPPVSELVKSLRAITKDKNNIILHDGPANRENTVKAVRRMVPVWIKQGYALKSLPQCTPSTADSARSK